MRKRQPLKEMYERLKVSNPFEKSGAKRFKQMVNSTEGKDAIEILRKHRKVQETRYDAVEAQHYTAMPLVNMVQLRKLAGLKKGQLEGKVVLDVGTGSGVHLNDIERLEPGVKTIALDISHTFAKRAKQNRVGNREAVQSDSGARGPLAIGDSKSQLTLCYSVIDRHPKPKELIGELARVTKKGGTVLIASPWPIRPVDPILGIEYVREGNRIPGTGFYKNLKGLEDIAKEHGLEMVAWSNARSTSISLKGPERHKKGLIVAFRKK